MDLDRAECKSYAPDRQLIDALNILKDDSVVPFSPNTRSDQMRARIQIIPAVEEGTEYVQSVLKDHGLIGKA